MSRTLEEAARRVAERTAQRAPKVAYYAETAFGDHAASASVPLEVVMAAAAHTFNMLDVDQQVDILEDEMARYVAAKRNEDAAALLQGVDGLTTVVSHARNQMRDDLIYRLMHERFDLIYAIAVRLDDAPEGAKHQQWLITPPRHEEEATPLERSHKLMTRLVNDLRYIKQKVETIAKGMSADLRKGSK